MAGGLQELDVWLSNRQMVAALLAFFAVSGALAAFFSQRFNWSELGWMGLLALPGMVISLLLTPGAADNPLSGWGVLAWLLAAASAVYGLSRIEQQRKLTVQLPFDDYSTRHQAPANRQPTTRVQTK